MGLKANKHGFGYFKCSALKDAYTEQPHSALHKNT